MRNIQKYTAALLPAVMILSLLLTGCSGRKDDGTVTITNVKANTPLTDAESETLRKVLQTYMELYEYSEAEQEKVLSLLSR